jgi:hypothetical protein
VASSEALSTARAVRARVKKHQKKAAARKASAGNGHGMPTSGTTTEELSASHLAESLVEKLHVEQEACRSNPLPSEEPEQFLCPITLQIMQDPVITADGHSYERAAIESWLEKCSTSPRTGAPLAHRVLTPSIALRQLIHDYQSTRQSQA